MLLFLLGTADAHPPCVTLDLLPTAGAVRTGRIATVGDEPALRDPFGVPNLVTSEHFAGRWGDEGGVTREDVEQLLAEFEAAWTIEVEGLGHPAPYGTEAFFFNVYVGDTGDNTPAGYGAGGYYTVDPDGFPMIVVALVSMADPSFRAHTAAHELYHALQGVSSRYAYEGEGAWFWEATAEWAALQVDPLNTSNGPFVFGYLLLPALPVNAFDYPDGFTLEEYHQYGAFLFPYDLTERVGEALVVDTWLDPGDEPDPIEVMRARTAELGEDLDVLWLDHIARATAYDYPLGDVWAEQTAFVGSTFPDGSFTSADVSEEGGEGRIRGDEAPRRYGTARIHYRNPDAGPLRIVVDGEPEGTEGSPAIYGARLVQLRTDGTVGYVEVPFDGAHGEVEVDVTADDEELYLVVSAWTEALDPLRWEDEAFPFSWSMLAPPPGEEGPTDTGVEPLDDEGGEGAGPKACGCSSGAGIPTVGWLAALPWLVLRRRGSGSARLAV